ncbi:MAG TPA: DUF899 domain-containing protein [Acidimicrobiales bacterium]|nr:DUF899 domain-containing protein [Acidimicrobiales bacterium]
MTAHEIVTSEDWYAARKELLALEKAHTRQSDELARRRRELPWLRIDKEYTFQTEAGPTTLAELFEGRSQLVIYNFMFGPDYEAGCPVCSSIADSFNGVLEHLKARDVTMVCVSRAPLEKLLPYRRRLGWEFTWASSFGSDFNFDFERSQPRDRVSALLADGIPPTVKHFAAECGADPAGFMTERPGLSVFALSDGEVYLTYSTTARGLEPVMVYYGILDLVPHGRDEGHPADPTWMRRRDEFAGAS